MPMAAWNDHSQPTHVYTHTRAYICAHHKTRMNRRTHLEVIPLGINDKMRYGGKPYTDSSNQWSLALMCGLHAYLDQKLNSFGMQFFGNFKHTHTHTHILLRFWTKLCNGMVWIRWLFMYECSNMYISLCTVVLLYLNMFFSALFLEAIERTKRKKKTKIKSTTPIYNSGLFFFGLSTFTPLLKTMSTECYYCCCCLYYIFI